MTIVEATKIQKLSDDLKNFAAKLKFLLKYDPNGQNEIKKILSVAKELDELSVAKDRFNKVAVRPVTE